jgi:predicted dehydrogenase
MTTITRRDLLQSVAGVSAATLSIGFHTSTVVASSNLLQNNESPGIALIGCGGRGRGVAGEAAKHGRMLAICDVDDANLAEGKKMWPDAATFKDFRKLLERQDINVIVNGTPDHWHTLINIAALRAGKDVYSEKPLTLTIDEGKHLVKVVRETKRILQTGSQQRSDKNFRLACEVVRNGRIGKLQHVDVWLPHGRREGPFKTEPVPAGLDWNMWLGPTPEVEYVKERCHLTFRYWWEYSGGTMTDWGAHHLDISQWGTGYERSGPVHVEGKPLVEMIPHGFTAYSEYELKYTYPNGVTQTCRSTTASAWNGAVLDPKGQQHGVRFNGTDGWVFVTRGKIEASDPDLLTAPLSEAKVKLPVSDNHMRNFFDCVQSRAQPICDAEIGHRSASVCHLGVIALRLGRKLEWNPTTEEFVNDADANQWLNRPMRSPWTLS